MSKNNQLLDYQDQINLLRKLIELHPIYGAGSQKESIDIIEEILLQNSWNDIYRDVFKSKELINDKGYVSIKDFSEEFKNDTELEKINLISILDSGFDGPTVILNGHYDVDIVSNPHLWEHRDGWKKANIIDNKLYGRGSSDMLAGLTSMLYVANSFTKKQKQWGGRIIFCAVTDEELGGNGSLHALKVLAKKGYLNNPDDCFVIIAEPSDNIIGTESLGFIHFKIVIKGKSVHMGVANQKDNAIYKTYEIIENFKTIITHATESFGNTAKQSIKYNFGIINGGKDAAIPIGEISLEGAIFHPEDISIDKLKVNLRHEINKFNSDALIDFSDFGFSGFKSSQNKLSRILLDTRVSGDIKEGLFPSPCDARLFNLYGISNVVVYGPGSLSQAHSENEYITLESIKSYNEHLEKALDILLAK